MTSTTRAAYTQPFHEIVQEQLWDTIGMAGDAFCRQHEEGSDRLAFGHACHSRDESTDPRVELLGPDGERTPGDLTTPDQFSVILAFDPLTDAGNYQLRWFAQATDDHLWVPEIASCLVSVHFDRS